MYLGYQDGKIKFYTEKPLPQEFYNLDKTEETQEEYILDGEEYVLKNEAWEEKQTKVRKEEFRNQFFSTSLGWIRRKVTMKDGSVKDFLTDIIPLLQVGIPVITYNEPDFTKDELPSQNIGKVVTEEFLQECKMQVLKDFYGEDI